MKTLLLLLLTLIPMISSAQSTIRAGRAIEIRIQGVPTEEMARVNNTYPVSDGGFIRMPFIGSVKAAGLTGNSLAQSIESRYRSAKIYTNPTIQVITSDGDSIEQFVVTVGGFVRAPGPKPFNRGLTLYSAVQSAGGATEFGSMYRVKLIRNGRLRQVDLTKTENKTILVQPNDTIEVPQKNLLGR
ncbi:polysaccharide biosynthesis/export family protein [Haloferula rosea]|uniref:Polysaccharide biosynthesis/export family protein n=1 Tax=Haloferula rosea TaxID=490093 RepID=A0A934VGZ8_9BACT|nr:polysaccharide biosynthesis/export family protein [Haloferula rosea]MBK1828557.1 polysaccharide biosynthesis/export family protein [Haloferula rosea]